ncbi:MAG: glycosyltransferase [Patescibacteria group bacterium]
MDCWELVHDLTDDEVKSLYQNAIALIMPQEEDFGYVACESALADLPVLVYRKGGQTEIILDNKNGKYFPSSKPEVLFVDLRKL